MHDVSMCARSSGKSADQRLLTANTATSLLTIHTTCPSAVRPGVARSSTTKYWPKLMCCTKHSSAIHSTRRAKVVALKSGQ